MSILIPIHRRQTWVRKETLNNLFQLDQSVRSDHLTKLSRLGRCIRHVLTNGVSEELLVPSFLAVIGAKTYGLLMNIVAPTADLTYAQIE